MKLRLQADADLIQQHWKAHSISSLVPAFLLLLVVSEFSEFYVVCRNPTYFSLQSA